MRLAFVTTFMLFTAASATMGQDVDVAVPEPYPADRYASMREKSPFALATPPVAPAAAPEAVFTANLILGGLELTEDSSGKEVYGVALRHKNGQDRFNLVGDEPNADGISIASVDRSPITGKTKVMLKKGTEFGSVEFDAMALISTPSEQPQPNVPNVRPGQRQNSMNPLGAPAGGGQPRPAGSRIQIPKPNVVPQINLAPAPGAPPPQSRRVRMIQSTPQPPR